MNINTIDADKERTVTSTNSATLELTPSVPFTPSESHEKKRK
nr:hypothetical protein [Listeria monocytogenes]